MSIISNSRRRAYVGNDDTNLSSGSQAAERGQINPRSITPDSLAAAQLHLTKQRSKVIDTIEKRATKQAGEHGIWPERLYKRFATLVLLSRGDKLLSYEEYVKIVEKNRAKEGDGGRIQRDKNATEDNPSVTDDKFREGRMGTEEAIERDNNHRTIKNRSSSLKSIPDILEGL